MGLLKSLFFSTLLFLASFAFLIHRNAAADLYTMVFKGCSQQTFTGNSGFQQTLTSLFDSLIAQSASTRFFKTSVGSGQNAATGLFQCRGDLSNADCNSCIRKIPEMSSGLCGNAVAARIQLTGCYALYQITGFPQIPGTQMLYKTCSPSEGNFEEKRDTAFAAVESGITGGNGFYATTYASVYAIAQCEGDLSVADCGQCVKEAVQKAQVECGKSVAGQVYLNRCYFSFSYYGNGVSHHSSPSGSGQQQTGKTVAIVVGGAAALAFGVICLLFLRSLLKKRDDY
ncbi:plasmodesmata-located protein 2-like [Magnolia sinica]|uniref:plasmodesmata-located protein 2-like n=1 Tax=Magnolia sinica TaxID=86752 RepID=UPI0026584641|nr:plasmodesmata-located protein 2-like [Magnolia sinica]